MSPSLKNLSTGMATFPAPGDIDRLSLMPDEVLAHILSFVPTKNAVQTSILSTRWEKLWTIVPAIELGGDFSPNSPSYLPFEKLVDTILSRNHSPELRRVSLRVMSLNLSNYPKFISWILAALNRRVQTIVLEAYDDINYHVAMTRLPESLFLGSSLRVLKLSTTSTVALHVAGSIRMPHLQSLYVHVDVKCKEMVKTLLENCPDLKDLFLFVEYGRYREGDVEIRFKMLKKLVIRLKVRWDHPCRYRPGLVFVDCPNLEQLDMIEAPLGIISTRGALDIIGARLQDCYYIPYVAFNSSSVFLLEFFKKIGNVNMLTISTRTIYVAYSRLVDPPCFPNLTTLELLVSQEYSFSWAFLEPILDNSPILETLIIRKIDGVNTSKIKDLEPIPFHFFLKIKTIELRGFESNKSICRIQSG